MIYNKSVAEKFINNTDKCFVNNNFTQLLYINLLNALKTLSSENKINLGKNCIKNVYIQGTTNNRLTKEVDEITNIILEKLNQKTHMKFEKIFNDVITEYVDKNGTRNFIYNVFIQDRGEELNIRLYIDVIKYISCHNDFTEPKPSYEIGYPQKEQLLPLPEGIISTGPGERISNIGINIDYIDPIKLLHINEVKIFNTNSVINVTDGSELKSPLCGNIYYDVSKYSKGIDSSQVDYPNKDNPYIEPSIKRNKWPVIESQPKNIKAWPCVESSKYWNINGIPLPSKLNSHLMGLKDSTTQFPVTPVVSSALFVLPRWSGNNSWLFSLFRGDPSVDGAKYS